MRRDVVRIFICFFLAVYFTKAFPQPPASQTAGGLIQQERELERKKKLEEKITKPKPSPKETLPEEIIPEEAGPKILIKEIRVEGATLIPQEVIEKITSEYENKELSLKDMQKVADLITDEYRKKGYVTSRAYIPPQTIRNNILIIRVVEGELGRLEIKGNRYFKTSLLEKKISLKKGEPFDYFLLQKSLTYINEHPDRTVKAVLKPGEEPGTTDIILEVKDNFPFHLGFEFDNYGSRYIEKDRYSFTVEHNNLLGWDDKLYFKYQMSEYSYYHLKATRYILPLSNTLEVGGYFIHSKTKLGREFEVSESIGKADVYGIFLTKRAITTPNLDLRFNFGFDYKDIKNYLLGALDSEDRLRVFKGGFDLDISDRWGRTIFTLELDTGVPNIMGGMSAKDDNASRTGAGGKFFKGVFNLFRLQPGPLSSYILWKNSAQYSNYNLVASEEFQIGGPVNVRGYPAAEFSGDKGYYTSLEWSFPPYFLPKKLKVPLTKDTLYDTFHIVLFYDWATVHLNKPLAGEHKHRTLKSAGFGFRLNLSNNFSAGIEFGYPLGRDSSDGHNLQRWVEVTKRF